jgi:hypothetical protein
VITAELWKERNIDIIQYYLTVNRMSVAIPSYVRTVIENAVSYMSHYAVSRLVQFPLLLLLQPTMDWGGLEEETEKKCDLLINEWWSHFKNSLCKFAKNMIYV